MKNTREILQDILRLDSIYGILLPLERTHVRGRMLGWHWAELSEPVCNLIEFLEVVDSIEIPNLKLGQDRLTYVVQGDKLTQIDVYRIENKKTQDILNQIIKL